MKGKYKNSYGIMCCRMLNERKEFLMIRRRTTYAYAKFAKGEYDTRDTAEIIKMLSEMTIGEKIVITSLKFRFIWFHLWPDSNNRAGYYESAAKFSQLCERGQNKWLIETIRSVKKSAVLGWELPRGRKSHRHEMHLQCAVREFTEETGIAKNDYVIYPNISRRDVYNDDGVQYDINYYAAVYVSGHAVSLSMARFNQVSEISDIRWVTFADLKVLDGTAFAKYSVIIKPLISALKKANVVI